MIYWWNFIAVIDIPWFIGDAVESYCYFSCRRETYQPSSIMGWNRGVWNGWCQEMCQSMIKYDRFWGFFHSFSLLLGQMRSGLLQYALVVSPRSHMMTIHENMWELSAKFSKKNTQFKWNSPISERLEIFRAYDHCQLRSQEFTICLMFHNSSWLMLQGWISENCSGPWRLLVTFGNWTLGKTRENSHCKNWVGCDSNRDSCCTKRWQWGIYACQLAFASNVLASHSDLFSILGEQKVSEWSGGWRFNPYIPGMIQTLQQPFLREATRYPDLQLVNLIRSIIWASEMMRCAAVIWVAVICFCTSDKRSGGYQPTGACLEGLWEQSPVALKHNAVWAGLPPDFARYQGLSPRMGYHLQPGYHR